MKLCALRYQIGSFPFCPGRTVVVVPRQVQGLAGNGVLRRLPRRSYREIGGLRCANPPYRPEMEIKERA